uniref:Uncharacterized protein n=1 Tax=Anguilla anguilla TaxID=7936 RepID=A0A0E9PLH6_ANGAN
MSVGGPRRGPAPLVPTHVSHSVHTRTAVLI